MNARKLLNSVEARFFRALAGAVIVFLSGAAAAPPELPSARPESVGLRSDRLQHIDEVVLEGIRRERMPGAVVLVGRHGRIAYLKAFGNKQLQPTTAAMTTDTLFDMASITKPVATATSIMILAERGLIHPNDPVAKHIPEFGNNGKEAITIEQLLTHQGGLIADNPLSDYEDGPAAAMQRIFESKPHVAPGTQFIYSDVGYIVLGEVVQRVSGLNVHEFSQKHIFQPLGMSHTGYLPSAELQALAATTEQRNGKWLQGEVHDPRAHFLGGIAGHAGLFSTARDLAVYAQMMAGGGAYGGTRILAPATWEKMTTAYPVPGGGIRGLGWDIRTGYSSNRGDLFSSRAFGHGGFTGTTLWIDPRLDLFVIFLSNRVHPDGRGSVNPLAGRIGTIAAAAIDDRVTSLAATPESMESNAGSVFCGIDVLQESGFAELKGRRVGLITNHTGVDRNGVSTATILQRTPNTQLVALFSPEHGLQGKLDVPHIADQSDESTGLKVFSLYGENRKPSRESLRGIDTLVFDIQDIGTRFYTYISTMGYAMQAAAEHGLRFVVLDRPNPINGTDVDGPVLDAGHESFVGFHRLPIRHGMTVGELARMFNAELNLGLDLHVVRMKGWRRSDFYDATGLLWINPSPNMRNLNQALLYPGIGLLETTNLSVGRGTDTPFEIIGAPWIDGVSLARMLNNSRLPGIRFVPIQFVPESSTFTGITCNGIHMLITDRRRFLPIRTGLEIARLLRAEYPDRWEAEGYNRLLANSRTYSAVLEGRALEAIEQIYSADLDEFRERRTPFLLYD